jgi:hypothetical protein
VTFADITKDLQEILVAIVKLRALEPFVLAKANGE